MLKIIANWKFCKLVLIRVMFGLFIYIKLTELAIYKGILSLQQGAK